MGNVGSVNSGEVPSDTEARLAREESFHDDRFAEEHEGRSADKFYAITGASVECYDAKLATIPTDAKCLELGCGPETGAWALLARGVNVTAIDISQVAIDRADAQATRLGYDHARFVKMNAEAMEFADDSFDVIYGDGILHHLDTDAACAELTRCLVPGGRLIFSEPTGHNPFINAYRRFTPDQRTPDEHPLVERDFEIYRSHFPDLSLEFFHLASLLALPVLKWKRFESLVDTLDRADRRAFERFPALRKYGWMVVGDGHLPRR